MDWPRPSLQRDGRWLMKDPPPSSTSTSKSASVPAVRPAGENRALRLTDAGPSHLLLGAAGLKANGPVVFRKFDELC